MSQNPAIFGRTLKTNNCLAISRQNSTTVICPQCVQNLQSFCTLAESSSAILYMYRSVLEHWQPQICH